MAALFGQQLAEALQNQDFTKLPYWHNDPKYDFFKAEDWWSRFEFAAIQGQWLWPRIQGNFMNCMRGDAIIWYKALSRFYDLNDIAGLRNRFLSDFASTANNRASIADVKIQQGNDPVIKFWSKLNRVYDDIELTVAAPVIPATQALILASSGAHNAANLAHVDALNLPQLQEDYRRIEALGYRRSMNPLFRAYFIAGLNPKIQDEVLRANPADPDAALEAAKRAEKDFLIKSHNLALNEVEDEAEVEAFRQGRPFRGRGVSFRSSRGRGFRGSRGGQTRSSVDKNTSECFYCNKKGHWQRECRKRLSENGAVKTKGVTEMGEEAETDPNQTFMEALNQLNLANQAYTQNPSTRWPSTPTASENW